MATIFRFYNPTTTNHHYTTDLNEVAARGIEKHKVTSAFLGYYDYPAVLCTSINEKVVHGIPCREEILNEGDIIGIDFGIFKVFM